MYVYTDGLGGEAHDDYDNTIYWCLKTMKGFGPDDDFVGRRRLPQPRAVLLRAVLTRAGGERVGPVRPHHRLGDADASPGCLFRIARAGRLNRRTYVRGHRLSCRVDPVEIRRLPGVAGGPRMHLSGPPPKRTYNR